MAPGSTPIQRSGNVKAPWLEQEAIIKIVRGDHDVATNQKNCTPVKIMRLDLRQGRRGISAHDHKRQRADIISESSNKQYVLDVCQYRFVSGQSCTTWTEPRKAKNDPKREYSTVW